MVEKLTEAEVDAKVVYTDEELMAYYQENLSEYIEDAKVRRNLPSHSTMKTLLMKRLMLSKLERISLRWQRNSPKLENLLLDPAPIAMIPGNTYFFSKAASARWSEFIEAAFALEVGETDRCCL